MDRFSWPPGSTEVPGTVEGSGLAPIEAMHLVLETAAGLAAAVDWKAILEALHGGLASLFRAEEVLLALPDREGDGFVLHRSRVESGRDPTEQWVARHQDNPIGWVVIQGRPLWINDLATEVRFPAVTLGTGSEILVPLQADGKPWGVLGCRAGHRYAYRLEDVELFRRVSRVADGTLSRLRQMREVRRKAFRDGLTGILNRGSFQQLLEWEMERCLRYGRRMSLLLIDVDDFKQINDSFGHPTGDRVLAGVARVLKSRFRRFDIAARFGGEEFAVVLPETPLPGGRQAAGKVCDAVRQTDWRKDGEQAPDRVTISIGVSEFPGCARSTADLLRSADAALYRAKGTGKDRVEIATQIPASMDLPGRGDPADPASRPRSD
jgi:diguanylate cyclase (GGDEF)-like protein